MGNEQEWLDANPDETYAQVPTLSVDPDGLVVVRPDNSLLVRVYWNGTIEFGEGCEPNVAAQAFWLAVRRNAPGNVPESKSQARRIALQKDEG